MRLLALWIAVVAAVGGCGGGPSRPSPSPPLPSPPSSPTPRTPLVAAAQLQDVSPAATWLAYTDGGGLAVRALATGETRTLAADGFDGRFALDDLLLFRTDPTTSGSSTFGALQLWRPGFAQAVRVTTGLSLGTRAPLDASFIAIIDGQPGQSGTLEVLKLPDCTATSCVPTTLGTYGELAVSPNGSVLAWTDSDGQLSVLDVASGQSRPLGVKDTSSTLAISPHGQRVAVVESGVTPAQLAIFDVATGQRVSWAAAALGDVNRLQFVDDDSLLVSTQFSVGGFASSDQVCTAMACTSRYGGACFVDRASDGTARWVLCGGDCFAARCQGPQDSSIFDPAGGKVFGDLGIIYTSFNGDQSAMAYSVSNDRLRRVLLPSGSAWDWRPGTTPIAFTPSASLVYRNASAASARLGHDDGAQVTDLAGPVATFVVRGATVWYDVTASDPTSGAITPGIYASPAP